MASPSDVTMDCIVLNRNLRQVTDRLCDQLETYSVVRRCFVVDAGSTEDEVSKRTIARDASPDAISNGLRPNRGFNLGIKAWLDSEIADWVLLLPNDSEVSNFDAQRLLSELRSQTNIVAVVPISEKSPYNHLLLDKELALAWNVNEGPILIRSDYLRGAYEQPGFELFDSENFRGYCSFLDLALKIYSTNQGLSITNAISFRENTKYTISHFELMRTEPYEENIRLMLEEGKLWLTRKYGYSDRRNLEQVVRLAFEEFVRSNPGCTIPLSI